MTILWSLDSGSALGVCALIGYFKKVQAKAIGFIMAFGSGVLISALSIELMEEAFNGSGFCSAAAVFDRCFYLHNR